MFAYRVTEELSLHLLALRDAEELQGLIDANRAHLREWLPWVDGATTVEGARVFIRNTRRQIADDNGFQTGIRYQGRLVGVIGFNGAGGPSREGRIGYWLAADAQGKGIMTSACRAYVSHAFTSMGLNRLQIRAAVGNTRSRAVPERLGFVQEGTLRQAEWLYDRFVDHAVYGLLSQDWTTNGSR